MHHDTAENGTSQNENAAEDLGTETAAAPGTQPAVVPVKKPRGFAAMDRARVSEISRQGGKAAHAAGTAHEFTSDEAREAGKKGGATTHRRRNSANKVG